MTALELGWGEGLTAKGWKGTHRVMEIRSLNDGGSYMSVSKLVRLKGVHFIVCLLCLNQVDLKGNIKI